MAIGLPQWKTPQAASFDSDLLKAAFESQMKAAAGWGELGKNISEGMQANREMGLKERLLEAQLADYDARVQGKGTYGRTGRSGASNGTVSGTGTATGTGTDFDSVFNSLYGTQPTPETVPGEVVQPSVSDAMDLKAALARIDNISSLPPIFGEPTEAVTPEQSQSTGGFSITPQASVQAPSTTPITNVKLDLEA
jgi:hypothetical protein